MVGKSENTVRTLLRIEAVILQGLFMGLLLAVVGVVLIPVVPFVVAFRRWRGERKRYGFLTRFLLLPLWLLSGCLFAILNPLAIIGKTMEDIASVAKVEWATRNMIGEPKKPNGEPYAVPTANERAMRDLAYTIGVIRDYNGEAKSYGQGLPIDERELE